MDPTFLPWVAGVIEGEGTIYMRKGRYPCVCVEMTDLDVLERLQEKTGLGRIYQPKLRNEKWKQSWQWMVQAQGDSRALLEAILPWLCSRRAERAREVLALHDTFMAA